MTAQPDNPLPAHDSIDSMLSRKFGKEVANYFSGSPLNRVGFLREDHLFLSAALKHPSTSILLCNNLQPLVNKATQPKVGGKVHFLKLEDVKNIVGEERYKVSEKEHIADYDSHKYEAQMIFLGIDEKAKEGLEYQSKNKYQGAPYFALDVTPREGTSVKEECEKLIKTLEDEGMGFAQGRVMDIDAQHGESQPHPILEIMLDRGTDVVALLVYSRHLRRSPRPPRLEPPQPLLRRLWPTHHERQRGLQARLPSKRRQSSRRSPILRNTQGHLKPLIPPYRPNSHHGSRGLEERAPSTRTAESLASILVLHARWVRGAGGEYRGSCETRGIRRSRYLSRKSCHPLHAAMALPGESDDWSYWAGYPGRRDD